MAGASCLRRMDEPRVGVVLQGAQARMGVAVGSWHGLRLWRGSGAGVITQASQSVASVLWGPWVPQTLLTPYP